MFFNPLLYIELNLKLLVRDANRIIVVSVYLGDICWSSLVVNSKPVGNSLSFVIGLVFLVHTPCPILLTSDLPNSFVRLLMASISRCVNSSIVSFSTCCQTPCKRLSSALSILSMYHGWKLPRPSMIFTTLISS